jgi:hypothetical protein
MSKLITIYFGFLFIFVVFVPEKIYSAEICYGGHTDSYEAYSCVSNSCSHTPASVYNSCEWVQVGSLGPRPVCVRYAADDGFCIPPSSSNSYTCLSETVDLSYTTSNCGTCTQVDGGWSDWSDDCSDECGQSISRTCNNPAPSCWGSGCSGSATGTCPNGDNGSPAVPYLVSPRGTLSDPANVLGRNIYLNWNAVSEAEVYNARVLDTSGNEVWISGDLSDTDVTTGNLQYGRVYQWQARSVNTTCDRDSSAWSGSQYFMTDYVPTLDSITVKNSSGIVVAPDALLRNNICQKGFLYDPNPRIVNVEAKIRDTDPSPDGVKNATLRWNGRTYPLSISARVGDVWTGTITIDYPVSEGSVGPYDWELRASDLYVTSAWIDSGRGWKIWDCQVPVRGNIFDGSAGQACNNTGFTVLADSRLDFSSLIYKDMNATDDVTMATSLPATYGTTTVIYGKEYLPLFNGGSISSPDGTIMGTGRFTRAVDLGTGSTVCATFLGSQSQFNLENIISAYTANPSAQVDFSFIRDQESWFQVGGGGVKAKTDIDSGVPVTMLPLSSRALSILGTYAGNGLISYGGSFRNINGFNDPSAYGSPNNWYVNVNTNDLSDYSYQYFYNTFYINGGVGVTGTSWDTHPSEGVYFVNGDMIINSDFTLDSGKTLIVIVKGKIGIGSNVNRVDGIFIADGNSSDSVGIEAGGTSDNQLVINGSLYSRKTIRLYRSFTNKRINNTIPAVKVNYQPNLLFNMPGTLMRVLSGWREL